MREGPVALCDGDPQRNALGRKTAKIERGQEQNMRLARYKTAMKKYDAVKHRKILRNDDLRCLDT